MCSTLVEQTFLWEYLRSLRKIKTWAKQDRGKGPANLTATQLSKVAQQSYG